MSIEEIIIEKITGDNPAVRDKGENSEDALLSEMCDCIAEMMDRKDNYAFRPISSHRKLTGGIIVFFKKTMRKLLKWYIEPICFQQTDFNNAAATTAAMEAYAIDMLEYKINQLNGRKESLEKSMEETSLMMQRLADENSKLKKRIEILEMSLKEKNEI